VPPSAPWHAQPGTHSPLPYLCVPRRHTIAAAHHWRVLDEYVIHHPARAAREGRSPGRPRGPNPSASSSPPASSSSSLPPLCSLSLLAAGWVHGLHYRPIRSNRRGPVTVYQIGLIENWSNSKPNLKSHVQSVLTGLPVGLTDNRPNLIFFV